MGIWQEIQFFSKMFLFLFIYAYYACICTCSYNAEKHIHYSKRITVLFGMSPIQMNNHILLFECELLLVVTKQLFGNLVYDILTWYIMYVRIYIYRMSAIELWVFILLLTCRLYIKVYNCINVSVNFTAKYFFLDFVLFLRKKISCIKVRLTTKWKIGDTDF